MIKDFSFLHLSTGDVLRKHVREGSTVGKTAQSFMVKGAWPTACGRVGWVDERGVLARSAFGTRMCVRAPNLM